MLKTKEKIIDFLEEKQIKNYVLTDDLVVNVNGDVFLNNQNLSSFPVQFGMVSKSFDCSHNKLLSLKGAPKEVGTYFDCTNNELTSLEYGPQVVGGTYQANHNQLKSLKYVATKIGNDLMVCGNHLENLLYCPEIIPGYINVADNQLKTLLGCAKEAGALHLGNNQLESLEHISEYVHFLIMVEDNPLKTLEFLPAKFQEIRFDINNLSYDFSLIDKKDNKTISLLEVELRKLILENKLNTKKTSYKSTHKI